MSKHKEHPKPETMRCQSCGRLLPVSAFAHYSITKCRKCAAKMSASRRKQKRNQEN